MKVSLSIILPILASATLPTVAFAYGVTQQECQNQGGQVVIGTVDEETGEVDVLDPEYECSNSNEGPSDWIVPADGEEWPAEVEVCCGGTGNGVGYDYEFYAFNMTAAECTEYEGNVVQDAGDGAVYQMEYICDSDGFPPIGNVTGSSGDTIVGVCCLEPWILSREECEGDMIGGEVVVDSGDGAIFAPDYTCESDGYPPIARVALQEGADPTAVCCFDPNSFTPMPGNATATAKALKTMSNVKRSNAIAHKKVHEGSHRFLRNRN